MSPVLVSELEERFGYPGTEVDYLCNIGKKRSFLYYETPKAACSTIKRTLQLLEADARENVPSDVHDKAHSPLAGALSSGWSYEDLFLSPNLFRFAFVRNPYSRALSCYLEKIVADSSERSRLQPRLGFNQQVPISFAEFLCAIERIDDRERDVHFRSQATLLNDRQVNYDYIGRFEEFDRDFTRVLGLIGIEDGKNAITSIRHHRVDAHLRVRGFFGPSEQALARSIYQQDFLRYAYSFELPQ
jgi:Sulfotransferase family